MRYQFSIGKGGEVPLPDEICTGLDINIGDILICEVSKEKILPLQKYSDQTLSDSDIKSARNLVRVTEFKSECFISEQT